MQETQNSEPQLSSVLLQAGVLGVENLPLAASLRGDSISSRVGSIEQ